ncbi:carbon-nitrogen hydrolase family protein [bacterium 210820-DFI.6.37]|nr:carbon-nitrogen hydrolase family protein [bacterium 210820-DFI.6.37]
MTAKQTQFKVAAVQMAPVQNNTDATIEKVVSYVKEAAEAGAKVIAFPEAVVPGYPWWIWFDGPMQGMDLFCQLYDQAVEIPSRQVAKLSQAAKDAGVYFCVSVTEKDGGSLYLTQLWFSPDGDLLGKHRKMKATSNEMTVWGDGDASMMPVFDTEFGRLGGLQCWEHYIPFNVATMAEKNEQIHVSSWPIGMPDPSASFADEQCAIGAQYYALATGTFTLCASQLWTPELEAVCCKNDAQKQAMAYGHGFTRIISPTGMIIAKMEHDAEGICYADIDLSLIPVAKYFIDPAGHYSTPGNMQLYVDASRQKPVHIIDEGEQRVLSYDEIQFEE